MFNHLQDPNRFQNEHFGRGVLDDIVGIPSSARA